MLRSQSSPSKLRELPGRTLQSANHRRGTWAWIEYILLALGLTLLAAYGAFLLEGALGSRTLLRKFDALDSTVPPSAANSNNENGAKEVDSRRRLMQQGHSRETSGSIQMKKPLAVLHIPKIHLAVPLLDGTDVLTLNHAVGRISGTAWPSESGNIGIAGHRDSFFRGLKDVRAGDSIELQTSRETDTYIVDRIQIVTPDAVEVLRSRPAPSLTLVTCYPFYFIGSAPQRFIVSASLTQQIESDRF